MKRHTVHLEPVAQLVQRILFKHSLGSDPEVLATLHQADMD